MQREYEVSGSVQVGGRDRDFETIIRAKSSRQASQKLKQRYAKISKFAVVTIFSSEPVREECVL